MRIGVLSDPELLNTNYRSVVPLRALARRGHEIHMSMSGSPPSASALRRCDVVHIHRYASAQTQELACSLRDEGVGIVWDNDDDITAIPRDNPNYRRLGPAGRRAVVEGMRGMVKLADVVTTPSAHLAERYRELGADDVRVLENWLPREFAGIAGVAHGGVVIACVAGLEHRSDYADLGLSQTLAQLLATHDELRVLTIGNHLGLPAERTTHISLLPFRDLVRTLAQADVGLAPLLDTPFNRARSNVKLKEYAAAGLAWLASPVGPYLGMGEKQGGRLVPDDRWRDELEQLIIDPRLRRKLAKRGARWVKDQYVDAHAPAWEAVFRDAADRASEPAHA